jgi:hypothetical protein
MIICHTDQEKMVWASTYSSFFANAYTGRGSIPKSGSLWITLDAINTADLAVQELRKHLQEELTKP